MKDVSEEGCLRGQLKGLGLETVGFKVCLAQLGIVAIWGIDKDKKYLLIWYQSRGGILHYKVVSLDKQT